MLDVGRMCLKVAGRESGKYCCIVKKIDQNFVLVTGPRPSTGVKRRKCNITHLEPLPEKIKIQAEASDEDVLAAYSSSGLFQKLGMKQPSEEDMKRFREQEKSRPAASTADTSPGKSEAKPKKAAKPKEKKAKEKQTKKKDEK